jgi:hypothetical protein
MEGRSRHTGEVEHPGAVIGSAWIDEHLISLPGNAISHHLDDRSPDICCTCMSAVEIAFWIGGLCRDIPFVDDERDIPVQPRIGQPSSDQPRREAVVKARRTVEDMPGNGIYGQFLAPCGAQKFV